MSPSHRAQDAIALEDGEQVVCARFGYGPLSLQSLEGEQVCVHPYVRRYVCTSGIRTCPPVHVCLCTYVQY